MISNDRFEKWAVGPILRERLFSEVKNTLDGYLDFQNLTCDYALIMDVMWFPIEAQTPLFLSIAIDSWAHCSLQRYGEHHLHCYHYLAGHRLHCPPRVAWVCQITNFLRIHLFSWWEACRCHHLESPAMLEEAHLHAYAIAHKSWNVFSRVQVGAAKSHLWPDYDTIVSHVGKTG